MPWHQQWSKLTHLPDLASWPRGEHMHMKRVFNLMIIITGLTAIVTTVTKNLSATE